MKGEGILGHDLVEQIRAANDIVDVIQWLNVPMKKAGAAHKALCPFHKEKTPSFTASQQRQTFHCFGCGAGGDVFRFVMMRENATFPDALRRLAERAHITLPEQVKWGGGGADAGRREQLFDVMNKAADWYHLNLLRSRQADAARQYLRQRGFNADVARAHRLGYSPPMWDGLIQWAAEQKIEQALLEEAGLIIKGEKGGFYDRFRDRLMIPIADEQGRVVAFSARILKSDAKEAKYVNSPETVLFKKGRVLFGLDRSKRALMETKTAVLLEGQLDWMRCFESGIHNGVAPQGTAFTEDQARLLNRYVEKVILCFDADEAGQKATWRNAEILIATGLTVRAARMPEGEDPDSFIRRHGAEKMRELLDQATDVFEYKASVLAQNLDMKEARNHRRVVMEMAPLLNRVENMPERLRFIQNVADILKMDAAAMTAEVARMGRAVRRREEGGGGSIRATGGGQDTDNAVFSAGDYLLRLALTDAGAARMLAGSIEEEWFVDYSLRRILFHVLQRARNNSWKPGWDALDLELDDAEKEQISSLLIRSMPEDQRSLAMGLQDAVTSAHRIFVESQCEKKSKNLQNPNLSEAERLQFLKELQELQQQLLDLARDLRHS
ncbi:MAG: DNA primase [Verrucomicrobiae bacterium]|nr:DNA primase [Verrucomicrobiae bacterium]